MKRILYFFAAMILIAICGAMVYVSGLIFDTTRKIEIEPYIMQSANLSAERVGRPVMLENLGDEFILNRLIAKFVHEYFYVIPDPNNVTERTGRNGLIWSMAVPAVSNAWRTETVPILSQMASDGIMRRVIIDGDARPAGDYYIVKYTLVTYDRPNIIDAPPTISRNNEIFLKLKFEKGVREERNGEPFNVKRYLENDGDPAAIFKFQVQEARFQ